MRITKRQLKKLIREAISGQALGPGKGHSFLDLTMGAMAKGDYKKASSYIMDSFMMDELKLDNMRRKYIHQMTQGGYAYPLSEAEANPVK